MCNGTWVCFDCRRAVRRPTWRLVAFCRPWLIGSTGVGRVRCPCCGRACRFLGPTIEVPPKRDVAGWRRLREQVNAFRVKAVEARDRRAVRGRHDLEQRIGDLQSRPPNAGRDRLVRRLREKLAAAD